jgi:hypothetical protein
MNFPQQVGLTEVYFKFPKFRPVYLDRVIQSTASYFPKNFLEIQTLEPTRVYEESVREREVVKMLSGIRNNSKLDIVAGISSGIRYEFSKKEKAKAINESDIDKRVIICGNIRPGVPPHRILVQELGHAFGLGHDRPPSEDHLAYLAPVLMQGFGLKCAESPTKASPRNVVNTIMTEDLSKIKKDGFSRKDYAYLKDLMSLPKGNSR